jgi:hypothetical protein
VPRAELVQIDGILIAKICYRNDSGRWNRARVVGLSPRRVASRRVASRRVASQPPLTNRVAPASICSPAGHLVTG